MIRTRFRSITPSGIFFQPSSSSWGRVLPRTFSSTIDIFCSGCRTKLYQYRKKGKGSLVKCFVHKIQKNYTNKGMPMMCHNCGATFARFKIIKGKPAHKIIGGKVFVR